MDPGALFEPLEMLDRENEFVLLSRFVVEEGEEAGGAPRLALAPALQLPLLGVDELWEEVAEVILAFGGDEKPLHTPIHRGSWRQSCVVCCFGCGPTW